ncbi:hypothetical protein PQR72_34625 [Paraburkholderia madseniana]|uniref:tail completion protein gp17 n=1 Tax=Paraburkholderia madseniana TaxID=2599607 RepID=UPI0015C524EB|nr:hypothetical protein [Paraburkholderia madseniana]NPT63601.1 hypothetical protein [Paraburkholderia madseniana]
MSLKSDVYAALSAILPNAWNVELPQNPTWPALVYTTHTDEESGWVMGGGYDLHTVTVAILGRDTDENGALRDQVVDAFEQMDDFLLVESEGDSNYEGDAAVYAYLVMIQLRTRRP